MARDIDPTLLRAFLAVVETGGMTSASRTLNLTQAAVSQQIKRLEELLQCELFERRERRVVPTGAGERMIGYARRLVTLNDEVWGLMTTPDFEGEVRLGVPHDITGTFMPPILRAFAAECPRVRVTLTSATTPVLLTGLAQGELDLTLTTEAEPRGTTLRSDPLVWTGARDGRAHTIRPLPVSLGGETCAFRAAAVKVLGEAGTDWRLMCQVGSLEPVIAMLEADLAIAPFLAPTVPHGLAVLPDHAGLPPLPVYHVNLHMPANRSGEKAGECAGELARQIVTGFQGFDVRASAAA